MSDVGSTPRHAVSATAARSPIRPSAPVHEVSPVTPGPAPLHVRKKIPNPERAGRLPR